MHLDIVNIANFEEVSIKEFNINEINSIKKLYKEVRDKSKVPTFPPYVRRY